MKKTRIISALLLASLLFSLCACGGDGEQTDTDGVTESQTEAETEEIFNFPDFSDEPAPFTVNGKEVSYTEYRYYLYSAMYQYDKGDLRYWDEATEEAKTEVKINAFDTICEIYAMEEMTEYYGISLTEDEIKLIEEQIDAVRELYSSEAKFQQYLDSVYLNEELNMKIAKSYYLRQKLHAYLIGSESGYIIGSQEELIKRFINNSLIYADRILIVNDYGDDLNENETVAKLVEQKLKDGEDFDELKKDYSEDSATNTVERGVYFAKGDYDSYYYDTALSLKEGEVSGLITTPYGYMVVKRLAFDNEYIEENLNGEFLELYQNRMFELMVEKYLEKQQITYSSSYETLGVETIK